MDYVHDRFGRELDGDGDGAPGGDRVDAFFRLYGDSDGDGRVGGRDLLRLLGAFGSRAGGPRFLAYFDYDGDGDVDVGDLVQLLRKLG